MQESAASATEVPATSAPRTTLGKAVRYGAGSIVATVCSEVAFLVMYGLLSTSTTWASIVGWLAGAVPNYLLNRSWAWGLRGRPSLRREVVPYVVIVLVTLVLAVLMTGVADRVVDDLDISDLARTLIVGAVFLGVYAVMFVLRFFLFDRLFSQQPQSASEPPTSTSGGDDD